MANTLATALRNIAIYPAGHPRFATAAADLVARMIARTQGCRPLLIGQRDNRLIVDNTAIPSEVGQPRFATAAADLVARMIARTQGCRPLLIGQRDNRLIVDNTAIPSEVGQPAWLRQRFREAGLRGIAFTATCTVDDVVEFGSVLRRARNGVSFLSLWPETHDRVRVHDLVFAGDFVDTPAGDSDEADRDADGPVDLVGTTPALSGAMRPPADQATRRLRQATRERLAADEAVTARLAEIEARCAHPANEPGQEFDLLAAVTAMLPADVAAQPEVVVDTVRKVLDRMAADLPTLLQGNGQVRGADVLRIAMGVARKYFRVDVPEQMPARDLPSGRPQDDAIDANLEKLQLELAALPAVACPPLPLAAELRADAPRLATELLGIHLHTFTNTERPEVKAKARQRLVQMFEQLDAGCTQVLQAYLGRPHEPAPGGDRLRSELLKMVQEAGQREWLLQHAYVDATFVAKSFPESLWLAARVLDARPEHRAILRQGLEALSLVIAAGGTAAASKTGVLRDPLVVEMLLRVDGGVASELLQVAAQSTAEIRRLLVAHLLGAGLPPAETAVLCAIEPAEAVPVPFLRELLRASRAGRFDAKVREATGALLRSVVADGLEQLPEARLLDAITNLRHVPDDETRCLLDTLTTHRRLWQLDSRARAIRRCARQVQAELAAGARR